MKITSEIYQVGGEKNLKKVDPGMFFSLEGDRKEQRFWKNILKPQESLNCQKLNRKNIEFFQSALEGSNRISNQG